MASNPAASLTHIDNLQSLREWMKKIKSNLESDISQKSLGSESREVLMKIFELSQENDDATMKLQGDQLTKVDAANVFSKYMKALTSCGTNTPTNGYEAECLAIVRKICINYSDMSHSFCLQLGISGVFSCLVAELLELYDKQEKEDVKFIICRCLDILYNCARVSENRKHFNKATVIAAILLYVKAGCEEAKVISMLILAYTIKEQNTEFYTLNDSAIQSILQYLKLAIGNKNHRGDGFTAEELVAGLRNLAIKDDNKNKIVKGGILPMLVELMESGSCSEQLAGVKMVWALSLTEANKSAIQKDGRVMESLTKLAKTNGKIGETSNWALSVLQPKAFVDKEQASECKTESTRNNNQKHIMISYE